jgi:hypothetical protein
MLLTLLLLLSALNPAWADRYWDLGQSEATQLAEKLVPGTILLTYCPGCEGAYHLIQVSKAQVVKSPQERDMFQVLVEQHIIHSGQPEIRCPPRDKVPEIRCQALVKSSNIKALTSAWHL